MRITLLAVLALCLSGLIAPGALAADGVVVRFAEPVRPDDDLDAFLETLRKRLVRARRADYRAIERMFAPRVLTFQRSLDPLQPWNPTQIISRDFLRQAADVMVEQGELPEGAKQPDLRPELLELWREILSENVAFGRIKQVPESICAPASYGVDRDAARAFAMLNQDGVGSLRFYPTSIELRRKPGNSERVAALLPAYTLASFVYEEQTPAGWVKLVASNGMRGYAPDGGQLYLSQKHICFAKVRGRYRISALFGYGL